MVLYRCSSLLAKVGWLAAADKPGAGPCPRMTLGRKRKESCTQRQSVIHREFFLSFLSPFLDTVSIICGAVINGGTVLSLSLHLFPLLFHLVLHSFSFPCPGLSLLLPSFVDRLRERWWWWSVLQQSSRLLPPFVTLIGLNSQSSTRSVPLLLCVLSHWLVPFPVCPGHCSLQ